MLGQVLGSCRKEMWLVCLSTWGRGGGTRAMQILDHGEPRQALPAESVA